MGTYSLKVFSICPNALIAYMSPLRALYVSFLVSPAAMPSWFLHSISWAFSNVCSFFILITTVLVRVVIVFSSVHWSPSTSVF